MQSPFPEDDRPAWHARAECARRGLPTEAFFPSSPHSGSWDPRVLEACNACPVRIDCLNWALIHNERVFGQLLTKS
jgi:hypothetical protein